MKDLYLTFGTKDEYLRALRGVNFVCFQLRQGFPRRSPSYERQVDGQVRLGCSE